MYLSDLIFALHILSLAITVPGIAYADHQGFLWLRGTLETLNKNTVRRAHRWVGVGLGMLIGSGFFLFWPMREYLLATPAFYIKMAFVITLLCNSFVIERLMTIATTRPFASLSLPEKTPLYASGALSTLCWLGAFSAAFFLT